MNSGALWLVCSTLLASTGDPFAEEFAPPVAAQLGTAAGQVRLIAGGGLIHAWPPDLALFGTVEWMARAFIGLRASGQVAVSRFGGGPHLLSGRLGPSLHFAPYHRVDFSLFFEGGIAGWELGERQRSALPIAVGGGAFDIALNPYLALHLEGALTWGVRTDGGGHFVTPSAWLGLAYAL